MANPCAASVLPPFAWPDAPRATSTISLDRRYLLRDGSPPRTLGEVRDRLDRGIRAAGYRLPGVLGAGCNGFAMVLDLERLRPDGRRVPGVDGFAAPGQRTQFSIAEVLEELWTAKPGFFRMIVLVVSDEKPLEHKGTAASAGQLSELAASAQETLPPALSRRPFNERYVVRALVYEFDRGAGPANAKLRPPQGRLQPFSHLRQAGLISDATPR